MLVQSLRRFGATAFAALSLATAACGGDELRPARARIPEPSGAQGTLFVSNDSDREIWYVFARSCGASAWGEDLLGSDMHAAADQRELHSRGRLL